MRISVDAEKCSGCRICEMVCSFTKLNGFEPKNACIKLVNLDYWGFSSPVVCIQCKNPKCVAVCTAGALTQTQDGVIHLDETRCDSCGLCVAACPIGAVNWHEEHGLPMICDLCGGEPACTQWCQPGAIKFTGKPEKSVKARESQEINYSVGKGKRSLGKLNVPEGVSDWYEKFL